MESNTHDTQGVMKYMRADDVIGRAVIRLGTLYARTEYDCWFPLDDTSPDSMLQRAYKSIGGGLVDVFDDQSNDMARSTSSFRDGRGKATDGKVEPAVRVRFSVNFDSFKARALGYLAPSPSIHEIGFLTSGASQAKSARFACFGNNEIGEDGLEKVEWQTLMSYIAELKSVGARCEAALADFEYVLFWRSGYIHLSLALLIGFQLVISYPALLPAAISLIFLRNLDRTYKRARVYYAHYPIHTRPRFSQVLFSLLAELLPKTLTRWKDTCLDKLNDWMLSLDPVKRHETRQEGRSKGKISKILGGQRRASQLSVRPEDGRSRYKKVDGEEEDDEEEEEEEEKKETLAEGYSLIARVLALTFGVAGIAGPLEEKKRMIELQVSEFYTTNEQARRGSVVLAGHDHKDDKEDATRLDEEDATRLDGEEEEAHGKSWTEEPGGVETLKKALYEQSSSFFYSDKASLDDDDDELWSIKTAASSTTAGASSESSSLSTDYTSRVQARIRATENERRVKARDLLSPSKMMAKVFSPVQHALGTLLVMPLRSLADLLAWEDPFATSWLYCGVFLLTILLLTIPLVTFLFVWGLRLVGIAAFGPHMHWVGLRMAESWEATRKEEAEFAAMSSSEKEEDYKGV